MGSSHSDVFQLAVGVFLLGMTAVLGAIPAWASRVRSVEISNPEMEQRIERLLVQMTLEEKVTLLSGAGMDTKPISRLGIPSLSMADGPHGVRAGNATCFPTGVGLASSWDETLVENVGVALAREVLAKGRNVLLGPCINIHRVPFGGRNFESFSEDPHLTARLAVAYVKGVQSQNVAACPKHYACNNQEWERMTIDARVDERAMREIYFPAFKAAVTEAGAWSIMAAYNRVNGHYACANARLLTDILKNEWGFQGVIMSDWGAVHSTTKTANAGLDLEMPTGKYFGDALLEAVKKGEVSQAAIDGKVRRILRVMFVAGLFGDASCAESNTADSPAHRALALEAARAGIVLLKNKDGVLPLDAGKIRSIAVCGPNAAVAQLGGGGSSVVTPNYSVSPLEGITKNAGDRMAVRYSVGCRLPGDHEAVDTAYLVPPTKASGSRGLLGEYFNNKELEGEPVAVRVDPRIDFDWGDGGPVPQVGGDNFSARWTGRLVAPVTGEYELAAISDDGSRLYLDGELAVDNWSDHAVAAATRTIKLEAGKSYEIRFEYYEGGGQALVKFGWTLPGGDAIAKAARLASESDVAVVIAGLSSRFESEGLDRVDLKLPGRQDELIQAVRRANPRTVVVLVNGSPVLMDDWVDDVAAIVEAWYPGQEGGQAVADVLFGRVNPSGKLPTTLPKSWEQCPAYGHYPGKEGKVVYQEGVFVGYRHFDTRNIEPAFPFGHGLSYTRFEYGNLRVEPERVSSGDEVRVSLAVRNAGRLEGKEVVQLYLQDERSSLPRPLKELKGFGKVNLPPGESTAVSFVLDAETMSFFDDRQGQWVVEPGRFRVLVGSSSRDIRLAGEFTLTLHKTDRFTSRGGA